MATKKQEQVVPPKANLPVAWQQRLAQAAEKQAKSAVHMGSGSTFISFKGGTLMVDGTPVPDNKFQCVVLGFMHERAWYEEEYDPNVLTTPDCYSYGPELEACVAPHENSKNKQSEKCKDCGLSKFGTAERGGGQACRQGVRLAIIAADPKTAAEAEIYQAKIPPTSIKFMKAFIDQVGAEGLPTFGVVAELSCTPDPKSVFLVKLKAIKPLPQELIGAVSNKLDEAERKIREPYPDMEAREVEKKSKAKKKQRRF